MLADMILHCRTKVDSEFLIGPKLLLHQPTPASPSPLLVVTLKKNKPGYQ